MSTQNPELEPETYEPSEQLKEALSELKRAEEGLVTARKAVRAAVAADLKAHPTVTNDEMASHLPWTTEIVRQISREYDVPRKRKPTVRSIASTKRTS